MTECKRCLLHEGIPDVRLDSNGLCSVCRDHDIEWGNWDEVKAKRSQDLERMFDDCRKKKRSYDVLVPLSGGKDSTYVLYLCAKKYNLKCLTVTWDNGFLSNHARENIKKATDALHADHLYYRVNWPQLQDLYRYFFLKTGMFCPVCMRGIQAATACAAEAFNIPLIVNGTCRRTEEFVSPQFFNPGSIGFFREALKEYPQKNSVTNFLFEGSRSRIVGNYLFWWTKLPRVFLNAAITLPDYVDWDYQHIYDTITKEVGWTSQSAEEEHGDCIAAGVVHYLRQRKFPVLIPELLRYSKLATIHSLTKEEARRKVSEANKEGPREPRDLDEVLKRLQVTRPQLEEIVRDPLRHIPFVKDDHGPVFRACRAVKRAILPKKK